MLCRLMSNPKIFTTRTVISVNYHDLEHLIREIYGITGDWSFVEDQECGNDSDHEFHVERKPLAKYEEEQLANFIQSKGERESYMANTILDDLCNKQIIEPGNYLVQVSW